MRITSIGVFLVTIGQLPAPDSPWNLVVMHINMEDGVSGYGEVGLAYDDTKESAVGMYRNFAKLVIGMDAMNNEAIWARLHNTFWGLGGGPVVYDATSAIGTTLWDIKGKAFNTPVYNLLDGKTNQKLRAHTSQIQFDWGKMAKLLVYPEKYGEACIKAKEGSYDYTKVDPLCFNIQGKCRGWPCSGILQQNQLEVAYERVKAVRDAGGSSMGIIIEFRSLTDTSSAVQLIQTVEELGIYYYEESTMPINASNMKRTVQRVSIPVASGERIHTRWGYRPFFKEYALRVIRPDLGNMGGFTEGKKVRDMARVYDVDVQVHICNGLQATVAVLQLEVVIPNFLIHEHRQATLLEANVLTSTHDYQLANGYFTVPDLSGPGQELNQKVMDTTVKITVK